MLFSKFYLVRAVEDKDIAKTDVITAFGLFEFTKMPFGLRNVVQTFQRLMNQILRDLPSSFAYLDDIPVAFKD